MNINNSEILVNTVTAVDVPKGCVMLSANLRETEGKPIKAEERYRNIVIPELVVSVEDRFTGLLLDKLYEVAKARFEATMRDSKRMARTVPAADYTVGALLVWYSQEAVSGRMTGETLKNWFLASATYKLVVDRKGITTAQNWLALIVKFASPNHNVNAMSCRVLLAGLQDTDAATPEGEFVAKRMQKQIEASEQSIVEGL